MTTLQEQARALGDPTRHAIFRRIAEAGGPVGVAELTEHFSFNHNAIRQHLAKLVAADLVVEATASGGRRGRPRLLYVIAPTVEGSWGTTGPYERLSRLLVEVIRTGSDPQEVGRRAADEFRPLSLSGEVVTDISAAMARQGFDPEVRPTGRGAEIVLRRCPFATAASTHRQTVCALHLGIAEGLAEGTSGVVEELVGYDPRQADCRLRIRVGPATGAAAAAEGAGALSLRRRAAKR
jgi:predicted ArsR family transcriptional regulator